jgi:CheY-like chemotaxis protein
MKTILVADNDAFQRQLVEMLLAVDNYKMIGFETGRQVLEYLQSHVPDVAILDYSLPDINGADLCAKIRGVKRLSKVPVILVTSTHKQSLVKGIAVAVKANSVLCKPLGDKKLREQVRALVQSAKPAGIPEATALVIDPIMNQALEHLPHLTQSYETLHAVHPPEPSQTLGNSSHDLSLAEPLPPIDIADLIDTQSLQDTSLPQLLQSESPGFDISTNEDPLPLDFSMEDPTLGSISEEELLDSLHIRIDEAALDSSHPLDTEPQVYRLEASEPVYVQPKGSSPILPTSNIEMLKEQVEQLGGENEQLKTTLRELDSGHPLHTSRSYLDAIEELEMLRRMTAIQSKQLNELQKHNQSLIEEVQLLKSQRRTGFFGFRSKKASGDAL